MNRREVAEDRHEEEMDGDGDCASPGSVVGRHTQLNWKGYCVMLSYSPRITRTSVSVT